MNRNGFLSIAIAIAAFVMACAVLTIQLNKKEKIAYVDSMRLLTNYEGVKEVSAELEKKTKVWQANVDTLEAEFQHELKNYEAERSKMTEKERKLKEELLQTRQQQYEQYRAAMEDKAKQENEKLGGKSAGKLNEFIKEFGKKHGYKIILGANQTGNVLYAEDGMDITDQVLQGANEAYKKTK